MSSSTGLGRTRSIRKPTVGKDDVSKRDGPSVRSEARGHSPSRLPVKPAMTTRSAAASAAASSSTAASRIRATSSTISRSVSNSHTRTSSTRTDSSGNTATKPVGRAASTRDRDRPPITSTNRTATGRPRSSGGPPATAVATRPGPGHTRAKSNVTSLTPATTLRPVSQVSQGTVTTTSSGGRTSPPASTITTSSKIQTRSQTRPRQTSQSHSATTTSTQAPSHAPTTGLASRPAFNTHQQHYSPAKSLAPKPLTSTFLAPPSPSKLPANVAISAETSRLQTELLQLSLLHRDAAAVDGEWHASARQKLGDRFARLAKDNDALLGLERRGVEARNVAALAKWGNPGTRNGLGLEEKIQILDEVLNGVWQLGEPGGRYARVVAGFEVWAERMAAIVTAQRSDNVDVLVEGDEVLFLGELDAGWKHDCVSLQRKLEGWRVALRDLGDIDDSPPDTGSELESRSSLLRMVDGCRALVHDMLSELAVMAQIEQDAARAEDEWIERTNRAIEDEDDDTPAARAYVPLWKLAT
ncbi:uncharacterized protein F4807DRAFT_257111 [Annulohypoxylon truncatum]|uniref:uncharacterized protein n=1 Tax=Annulohypoxylon truncatum TaxID=327061 RepID=UPI0020085504|nr:uncharacterized protein F4807DRAFT_257111 [Annulohypoxylon truncatum]KAI1213273.1 hypothetical protein F4807DRAFT_257111 [Annulohypoxylon truncatum]